MKIQITAEHIAAGRRCDPCRCPLALAIADNIGERVMVGPFEIERYDHPHCQNVTRSLPLPLRAQVFVKNFDSIMPTDPVEPTEIEIMGLEEWRDDKPSLSNATTI